MAFANPRTLDVQSTTPRFALVTPDMKSAATQFKDAHSRHSLDDDGFSSVDPARAGPNPNITFAPSRINFVGNHRKVGPTRLPSTPAQISRATRGIERAPTDTRRAPTDIESVTGRIEPTTGRIEPTTERIEPATERIDTPAGPRKTRCSLCSLGACRGNLAPLDAKTPAAKRKSPPAESKSPPVESKSATDRPHVAALAIKTTTPDVRSTIHPIEPVDAVIVPAIHDIQLAANQIDFLAFHRKRALTGLAPAPDQAKSPHHEIKRARDRRNVAADDTKTTPTGLGTAQPRHR